MSALFLLTYLNCFSGIVARAATISVSQSRNDLKQIIVSGELVPEDLDRFVAASANAGSAIVRFDSLGGRLQTGLLMGLIIRQRGYTTAVGAGSRCYSSCALAWLGGRTQLNDVTSRVGFHAASDANHVYSPEGTAMIRAYARSLGLGAPAARILTEATPNEMEYLTADMAKQIGVNVVWVGTGGRSEIPCRVLRAKRRRECPSGRAAMVRTTLLAGARKG
jgi:hypothetical protein